jgi:hypothetical protein
VNVADTDCRTSFHQPAVMANVVKKAVSVPADLLHGTKEGKMKTYQSSERSFSPSPSVESVDLENGECWPSRGSLPKTPTMNLGQKDAQEISSIPNHRSSHLMRGFRIAPISRASSIRHLKPLSHLSSTQGVLAANFHPIAGARLDYKSLSDVVE